MPDLVTRDSSVIVAALRRQEEYYSECQSLLEEVRDGDYVAVEPYTVLIEIAAAIKRRTGSQKLSERVTKNLLAIDTIHFLDLDAARAKRCNRYRPAILNSGNGRHRGPGGGRIRCHSGQPGC